MAPRTYDDTSSNAIRIDGLVRSVAGLEAENKTLRGDLRELQDELEAIKAKPAPIGEDKKLLALLLDTRTILFLVALAVICGAVAIMALVLSGNGGAVLELAKGLKG